MIRLPSCRILILLACLRPHLLLPAYLAAATGLVSILSTPLKTDTAPGPHSAAAFLGWSLVLAAVHITNLLADQDTDQLNAKNLFWMDQFPPRTLAMTAALLATTGLIAAGWAHPTFLLPVGSTLLLGWAYCLRPLQWSRRWGWDALANVLGYGVIAPWLGAWLWPSAAGADEWALNSRSFPVYAVLHLVPLVFAGFILTTILDRDGDLQTGKRTWAVRFRPEKTFLVAVLVLITAGVSSFFRVPDPETLIPNRIAEIGSPLLWLIQPGKSHLLAALLAGMAGGSSMANGFKTTNPIGWLGPEERIPRWVLIGAVFVTVLGAGGPALLAVPWLGLPFAAWLCASYLLLIAVRKR